MIAWTPVDAATGERLSLDFADVKALTDERRLHIRCLGLRGLVEFGGKRYEVWGRECGLRGCDCDAELREVRLEPGVVAFGGK